MKKYSLSQKPEGRQNIGWVYWKWVKSLIGTSLLSLQTTGFWRLYKLNEFLNYS